jgi:hypothetical protein
MHFGCAVSKGLPHEVGDKLREYYFATKKSNLEPRDTQMTILQQAARTQKARRNGHYELQLVLSPFNQSIILRRIGVNSCAEEVK